MFRSRIFLGVGLAVALVLTFGARSASADIVTSTLDSSNLPGFATGNFGTMSINLTDSTHATITFTSNSGSGFLFGDGNVVDVNVNASTWSVSNISFTQISGAGFNVPTISPDAPNGTSATDGFGVLNQTFTSSDGFASAVNSVTFTLTNTSGGTWANASSVLIANSQGVLDAAHIFLTSTPISASNTASLTGFAAEGTLTTTPSGGGAVPEPSTMVIAALGALGFVGYGLRRRLKK